jgi:hypothetical protein
MPSQFPRQFVLKTGALIPITGFDDSVAVCFQISVVCLDSLGDALHSSKASMQRVGG